MTMTKNAWSAIVAVLATLAVVAVFLFVPTQGAGATNGDEPCTPQAAVPAVFGEWEFTGWTDWQADYNRPDDPDGTDEDDVNNVIKYGERQSKNTHVDTVTETVQSETRPEGEGWYVFGDPIVVTDVEAYDEVIESTIVWWNLKGKDWAPNTGVPPVDHPSWQPHGNVPNENSQHSYPGENGLGVPYQPGADNGNGDWFRFTGEPERIVHHEAVTHVEYIFKREVKVYEWRYRFKIYERVNTPAVAEVVCETPTETPTVTETPVVPTETVTVNPPVPTETVTETPEVPTETETPVSVPQPEEDEPVKTTNIPKDVQVIACVNGVWTITVNGEVISESGTCGETPENTVPQTFSETGL